MNQSVELPEPLRLGQVAPESFVLLHQLAQRQGYILPVADTSAWRLQFDAAYQVRNNQFVPTEGKNLLPDQAELLEAVEPFIKQAQGWLHHTGTVKIKFVSGIVQPGDTLLPPPLWHVDEPHNDHTRFVFASDVDPTEFISGELHGTASNAYIHARELAAGDTDHIQANLRKAVQSDIDERRLKIGSAGFFEVIGMNNTHVHRPRINQRNRSVKRGAVKILTKPSTEAY